MLYYGLDDLAENEEPIAQMNGKNIYTFLVMGAICSRKNQLFAIQAYNLLPKKIRAASKLMLVGTPLDEKDPYYIEFLRVVKQYPEIDYIPRVERSEIPALYRQINALICCSIDDPLPVVVTECFMFGKNVIISSGSGQYYMVKDEYDGYSYLESDVNALCKKMISAWSARDDKARIRCSTGIACICVTVLLILGRRIVVRIKPWMLITIVLGITAVMIFSNVLFNNPMIQYFVVNVLHRSGMMTGRVEIYNTFLKIMRTDIWLGAGYDNTIVMQNTTLG